MNWANVDGDANADVIVVDAGTQSGGSGAVWTFPGVTGGYDPPVKTAFLDTITDARVADVNGDGKADLVIAENDGAITNANGDVRIVPGTGDKTNPFDTTASTVLAVGVLPYRVRFADIDDDGITELVVTDRGGSRVAIVPFDGGVDGAPIFVPTGDTPTEVIVADIDGDYLNDLIVLASYRDPYGYDTLIEVDVVRGLGARQFDLPERYRFAGGTAHGLQYDDLDGDGLPDIAVTVDYPASVQVLRGHDGGKFQDAETALVGGSPRGVAIVDFDGDGKLDLIVGDASTGSLRLLANGSR